MTSPVAGFSTAISPAAVAVPLVAGCSSTVATALAPASFDGVSNTTVGSDVARRPRPRRARSWPSAPGASSTAACSRPTSPAAGRARSCTPSATRQSRAALRARVARPRPTTRHTATASAGSTPTIGPACRLLRRVRMGRGHRPVWGRIEAHRDGLRAEHARVRALARRPGVAAIAAELEVDLVERDELEPRPGAMERRCRPGSCPSRRSSRSRCRSARPGGRGRRSASSRCARPRPGRR